MGSLNGEEADKLDERLWGDDEDDDEDNDSKDEETGPGMDEVIKSLGPGPALFCVSFSCFSCLSFILGFSLTSYS